MDIVRTLSFPHLKGSFQTLHLKQKFFFMVFVLSLIISLMPHQTYAAYQSTPKKEMPVLVFDLTDKSYQNYMDSISQFLSEQVYQSEVQKQVVRQQKLTQKVRSYLQTQKSPLANYADVLVTTKNWKKIVALSNAESSMCRNYPTSKANCWGVGGSDLWDMGNTLSDGIITMNKFLNNYPLKAKTKYAQMSFKQMNGLYKQPAAAHWLYNVQSVFDELSEIEKGI